MTNHITEATFNAQVLLRMMARAVESPQILQTCHQLSPRNYFRLWKMACEQGCTEVTTLLQQEYLHYLNACESMNALTAVRQAALEIFYHNDAEIGVPRPMLARANEWAARYGDVNEPLSIVEGHVRAASKILRFINPVL